MIAPEWFLETQRDMRGSEMEWIPEGVTISDQAKAWREAAGWKLIDQSKSPSPTASKEYGRHWIRKIPVAA